MFINLLIYFLNVVVLGYYMFIETSSPRKNGDTASLISPTIASGPKCFTFWYHMYGPHIDTLNIYTLSNKKKIVVWKKTGTQGNSWRSANITVGGASGFQVNKLVIAFLLQLIQSE